MGGKIIKLFFGADASTARSLASFHNVVPDVRNAVLANTSGCRLN